MKKILFIITLIAITGCSDDDRNPDGSYDTSKSSYVETVVIDSCEYISAYSQLAHKGNCRFCKNRMEKEIEKLIINLKEN